MGCQIFPKSNSLNLGKKWAFLNGDLPVKWLGRCYVKHFENSYTDYDFKENKMIALPIIFVFGTEIEWNTKLVFYFDGFVQVRFFYFEMTFVQPDTAF